MPRVHDPMSPVLGIWTIYDSPLDHPGGHIARLHEVGPGFSRPTGDTLTGPLEVIREMMRRKGLYCLGREPHDDPVIVESWV